MPLGRLGVVAPGVAMSQLEEHFQTEWGEDLGDSRAALRRVQDECARLHA